MYAVVNSFLLAVISLWQAWHQYEADKSSTWQPWLRARHSMVFGDGWYSSQGYVLEYHQRQSLEIIEETKIRFVAGRKVKVNNC